MAALPQRVAGSRNRHHLLRRGRRASRFEAANAARFDLVAGPAVCRTRCRRLVARVGAEHLDALVGHAPDPTWGIGRIMWVAENEPDVMARTACWLPIADLVTFWLCGSAVTSPSLGSRLMIVDQNRSDWSREVLDGAGIDPAILPLLVESGTRRRRRDRRSGRRVRVADGDSGRRRRSRSTMRSLRGSRDTSASRRLGRHGRGADRPCLERRRSARHVLLGIRVVSRCRPRAVHDSLGESGSRAACSSGVRARCSVTLRPSKTSWKASRRPTDIEASVATPVAGPSNQSVLGAGPGRHRLLGSHRARRLGPSSSKRCWRRPRFRFVPTSMRSTE